MFWYQESWQAESQDFKLSPKNDAGVFSSAHYSKDLTGGSPSTLRKKPLNLSERRQAAWCGRRLKEDVYYGNSDEIVSEEDRNPACTSRSGAHGKKQSMMP